MTDVEERFCWRCLFLAVLPVVALLVLGWYATQQFQQHRQLQQTEADALLEQLDDLEAQNADLQLELENSRRALDDARALLRTADQWSFEDLLERVMALPPAERRRLLERMGIIEQGFNLESVRRHLAAISPSERSTFWRSLAGDGAFRGWIAGLEESRRRDWVTSLPLGGAQFAETIEVDALGVVTAATVDLRLAELEDAIDREKALRAVDVRRRLALETERDVLLAEVDALRQGADAAPMRFAAIASPPVETPTLFSEIATPTKSDALGADLEASLAALQESYDRRLAAAAAATTAAEAALIAERDLNARSLDGQAPTSPRLVLESEGKLADLRAALTTLRESYARRLASVRAAADSARATLIAERERSEAAAPPLVDAKLLRDDDLRAGVSALRERYMRDVITLRGSSATARSLLRAARERADKFAARLRAAEAAAAAPAPAPTPTTLNLPEMGLVALDNVPLVVRRLQRERDGLMSEVERLRDIETSRRAAVGQTSIAGQAEPAAIAALRRDLAAAVAEMESAQTRIDTLRRERDQALSAAARAEETSATADDPAASALTQRLRQLFAANAYRDDAAADDDSLRLSSGIAFESASARLSAAGRAALDQIAEEIRAELEARPGDDWRLIVEGHTDRRPIRRIFPSNWELSAARAAAVARYLGGRGVPEERIIAAARASFEPIDPRDTAEAFAANRRIEFEIARR